VGRCNSSRCPVHGQPAAQTRTETERKPHRRDGDDLAGALACCRAWEPDARLIGNVRASTLLKLLERVETEQMGAVPEDTLRRSLTNTLHTDEHSRAPARAELARRGLK
jgi:hypothetical protein